MQLLPAELPEVRTGCPVARVVPAAGPGQKVTVQTEAGQEDQYDAVIMATHSDISKALLDKAAPQVSLVSGLRLWGGSGVPESTASCLCACI